MSNPMPEDIQPPVGYGWFTTHQREALLRVMGTVEGLIRVAELYELVRRRVELCRELSLTSGQVIKQVMAQTRAGHKGINQADLLPITRGMLTAIFRELDDAGD
jgi:hypothetical protein